MDASLPQGATDAASAGGIPPADADAPATLAHSDEPAPEDDDLDVPDVIEDVIEHLLTGLKDKVSLRLLIRRLCQSINVLSSFLIKGSALVWFLALQSLMLSIFYFLLRPSSLVRASILLRRFGYTVPFLT